MRWRLRESSSSATPLRKHQQNDAFGSSSWFAFKNFEMCWRLMVKNIVTSFLQRMQILSTTFFVPKQDNLIGKQEWLKSYGTCQFHLRVCVFLVFFLACSSPLSFFDFFLVLLRIRGFQRFEFVNSLQQQLVSRYVLFRVHLMIWCIGHCL